VQTIGNPWSSEVVRIVNPWLKGAVCKSTPAVANFYTFPNELEKGLELADTSKALNLNEYCYSGIIFNFEPL